MKNLDEKSINELLNEGLMASLDLYEVNQWQVNFFINKGENILRATGCDMNWNSVTAWNLPMSCLDNIDEITGDDLIKYSHEIEYYRPGFRANNKSDQQELDGLPF